MEEKRYQKDAAASPKAIGLILILLTGWLALLEFGIFRSTSGSWSKVVLLGVPMVLLLLLWVGLNKRRSRDAQKKPH